MTLAFVPPSCPASLLSRRDPHRLAALVLAAAAASALDTLAATAAALAASLLLAGLGRMPLRWCLGRMGGLALVLLLFAVLLPFLIDDGGAGIELGPLWLSLYGLAVALALCLKALTIVTLMLVVLVTAPLDATLKAAHALHVPGLLIQLVVLTYRYVFLLADELARLVVAVRVRGYRLRPRPQRLRLTGLLTGTLLVRGYERAERVGQAMRCRGFDGRFRSLAEFHTRPADVAAFVLIVAGAAGLLVWDVLLYRSQIDAEREKRNAVSPAIHVAGLTYAYPRGPTALDGVSFTASAGESIGLVGPNGAGKTTLFLCLSGVLPIKPGMARLAGLDPALPAERRNLPARVGIVFQNSDDQLVHTTVFDDVAFGPLNLGLTAAEVRARVDQALEQVGLAGMEQRVPYHLSGGEKRRAALAGVLAMRPEILLLDEPSMYLDPRGRRDLIRLINPLGVTRVIASHDLEMIRETCTRVLMLDGGRLVADGPVTTVLADAALMEAHGLEVPHSLTHHTAADRHRH